MINLLPPETKASFNYARRNLTLRNWVITLSFVLLGVGGLFTFGLINLHQSVGRYQNQVAEIQNNLKKDKQAETEKKVKDISSSLRLATQVLGSEIVFSKLITQIGATIPSGAVLTSLNINKANAGLDLTANAKDPATATQVQVNLSSSKDKIFAKADIINITRKSTRTDKPEPYPYAVTLRALFNSNNQFLFINQPVKP